MDKQTTGKTLFSTSRRRVDEIGALRLGSFFDLNSPWVLVDDGSLMGFFNFVPRRLRVGPWTKVAPVYMTILVGKLVYWMPHRASFYFDDEILSTHPTAYSSFWFYNAVAFIWMALVLLTTFYRRGPCVMVTYTVQSWITITIRHGLSALAPFLSRRHLLVWLNEILRFPALATASITFFYWNFVIAPTIYYILSTPEKRKFFWRYNFNFRMIQLHFFNIIFAVLNTVFTSSRTFHFVDLWCALAGAILYALMYLLVLDRIGVHLYPVFSPRTSWSVLSWTALMGTYFALFYAWNRVISHR